MDADLGGRILCRWYNHCLGCDWHAFFRHRYPNHRRRDLVFHLPVHFLADVGCIPVFDFADNDNSRASVPGDRKGQYHRTAAAGLILNCLLQLSDYRVGNLAGNHDDLQRNYMKNILLSADNEIGVFSVPDKVADNLEQYCLEFCCNWLHRSPKAAK